MCKTFCMYVFVLCVCLVPVEARSRPQICWNCSHEWLWLTFRFWEPSLDLLQEQKVTLMLSYLSSNNNKEFFKSKQGCSEQVEMHCLLCFAIMILSELLLFNTGRDGTIVPQWQILTVYGDIILGCSKWGGKNHLVCGDWMCFVYIQ